MHGATNARDRIEVLKLAKELGATSMAGHMLTLMVHAEGSIEASRIELFRNYDFNKASTLIEKILKQKTKHATNGWRQKTSETRLVPKHLTMSEETTLKPCYIH